MKFSGSMDVNYQEGGGNVESWLGQCQSEEGETTARMSVWGVLGQVSGYRLGQSSSMQCGFSGY